MANDYVPIDCGVHDRLETLAMRRALCELRVRDARGSERVLRARITDVFADGGEEFVLTDRGERFRLDRLRAIWALPDGRAR